MAVYNHAPMSPRPRQASDEDILMAAFRAIARLGPARMTLADVAKDAGVSPAAIVQRFGSKRALLLAAAADAAGGSQFIFPGLRARHRRPIDALLGLADCMTVMGTTPEAIANNMTFLQIDLRDERVPSPTRSPPRRACATASRRSSVTPSPRANSCAATLAAWLPPFTRR